MVTWSAQLIGFFRTWTSWILRIRRRPLAHLPRAKQRQLARVRASTDLWHSFRIWARAPRVDIMCVTWKSHLTPIGYFSTTIKSPFRKTRPKASDIFIFMNKSKIRDRLQFSVPFFNRSTDMLKLLKLKTALFRWTNHLAKNWPLETETFLIKRKCAKRALSIRKVSIKTVLKTVEFLKVKSLKSNTGKGRLKNNAFLLCKIWRRMRFFPECFRYFYLSYSTTYILISAAEIRS